MKNNLAYDDSLLIKVWIIQESLAPEPITTINICKDVRVSDMTNLVCLQLDLEPERYEMLLLQVVDSSYILKEFKSNQLRIEQTLIPNTLNVCLKFEDINWDFSKNTDSDFSAQICAGNLNFLQERIKGVQSKTRNVIKYKSLQEIKKNLLVLLTELKIED